MYAALLPIYLFIPLALGSYVGSLPALLMLVVFVARIFDEERVLGRDLEGYNEYMNRVKYRLIPGIW
jgi:protein-S-isoprenylcysteine O-methyltransferase Ste14